MTTSWQCKLQAKVNRTYPQVQIAAEISWDLVHTANEDTTVLLRHEHATIGKKLYSCHFLKSVCHTLFLKAWWRSSNGDSEHCTETSCDSPHGHCYVFLTKKPPHLRAI